MKILWIVIVMSWAVNFISLLCGKKQDKVTIGAAYLLSLFYSLIQLAREV